MLILTTQKDKSLALRSRAAAAVLIVLGAMLAGCTKTEKIGPGVTMVRHNSLLFGTSFSVMTEPTPFSKRSERTFVAERVPRVDGFVVRLVVQGVPRNQERPLRSYRASVEIVDRSGAVVWSYAGRLNDDRNGWYMSGANGFQPRAGWLHTGPRSREFYSIQVVVDREDESLVDPAWDLEFEGALRFFIELSRPAVAL